MSSPYPAPGTLPDFLQSPQNKGVVTGIAVRPDLDQRAFPDTLHLHPETGVEGDRWIRRTWKYLEDGSPDPRVQVALCNSRFIDLVWKTSGSDHHPGDNLIVDFDLSEQNLPAGFRIRVGTALLEISDVLNDGCAKFAKHYGKEAFAWTRHPDSHPLRIRGCFARILEAGQIRIGDPITKKL